MSDSKANNAIIKKHYKKVAKNFGLGPKSSIDDPFIRESEIRFIENEIELYNENMHYNPVVLDTGCGNAYLLSVLNGKFPKISFIGMEYTQDLYELAVLRKLKNTRIVKGDCREEFFEHDSIDIIITERVIINILNLKEQFKAIENIARSLKKGGRYIMVESFKEPLTELNHARKEMCLEEVTPSTHNRFLSEKFVERMEKYSLKEMDGAMPANFLSSYFYITRVFHKSIRPSGGRVKFSRMANFFRDALPPAIGNYSPILFRVFEKV